MIRKFKFIIAPFIVLLIYFFSPKTEIDINTIVNLSGALSGFLFTTMGIIISLPNNKFTEAIKDSSTLKSTYITIFSSVILFFISMLWGIFIKNIYIMYPFLAALSNALLSAYDLFFIGYFSGKSK